MTDAIAYLALTTLLLVLGWRWACEPRGRQ